MKIRNTSMTQVILVHFDEIPMDSLVHRPNLERLAKHFKFNNAETLQDSAGKSAVVCHYGVHASDNDERVIKRLVLEERRILFEVDGPSRDADAFFTSLTSFLADLRGRTGENYLKPIVKSEESEIVAHLDFSVESLLSPTYLQFVESVVASEASSDIAEANVKPASLIFNIEYLVKDSSLSDYRITLSRKDFIVGPRAGYPLADRIYYSKAPFDTNTHIQLLEKLEKTVLQIEE